MGPMEHHFAATGACEPTVCPQIAKQAPEVKHVAETAADYEERQAWMSVLSKAEPQELAAAWASLPEAARPGYEFLRAPEIGLVMVRGRTGGEGDRFNLGEMTVTRCAVRLDGGETGVSYRAGRDRDASEVAAVLDGILQREALRADALPILKRLEEAATSRRAQQARRSGATKVEFFTMTRTREDKA